MKNIYDPMFVEKLFDRMSNSYSKMNYVTSFGFSERWRRQCVEEIKIEKGSIVVDLMTGMGECWKYILKNSNTDSKLIGLDFSTEMTNQAIKNKINFKNSEIEVLKEDVFQNTIEKASADYIISGFGLKTFNQEQLVKLAKEINRILKLNGKFSLIDVSVPKNRILRSFYLFYLKRIIPFLGRTFVGNPESYRMLGVYTEEFKNSKNIFHIFCDQGFEVEYVEYFFGCASGIKGKKIK